MELDLSYNSLTSLPDFLGQMPQLKRITAHHNRLTTLPTWFSKLDFEAELNLSNNQLAEIPEWLQSLEQVKKVSVSHNQLTSVPSWFVKFETLDLSSNPLKPEAFPVITTLLENNKTLKSLK